MLFKYLSLFLLFTSIYATNNLNDIYYVDSYDVRVEDIVKNSNDNAILLSIPKNKHTKKMKSKILIKILKAKGYIDYKYKHNYVNFIKKSPIDTTKIKEFLRNYYEDSYESIKINNITVEPRSYTEYLPQDYIIKIRPKNFLSSHGTLSIKTRERKKIFFNYIIDANVDIYISRKKIKKKTELSALNSFKKSIILDKFKAKPIQNIKTSTLQSKHHISKDKILTIRDVEELSIVKKGSYISIGINNNNIDITFSAKALEDGKINEIIRVIKPNGKKLKVKVIGKNRAEIR